MNVAFKTWRFSVACHLLNGERNLVFFNRCRSAFTAQLRCTCGAGCLRLDWRCSSEEDGDIFLNPCKHVICFVWATFLRGLLQKHPCFSIRILLGRIFSWFLVSSTRSPGCFRNGSGVKPSLWNQRIKKNSLSYEIAPEMQLPILLDSWGNLFVPLPLMSSDTWVI